MELKEAFLDFFHFSLPLKEHIRNSEMPVVFVDFEGKVFKEDDRVIRYSWEAENGSWVKAYLIPNERTIYLCNNKFEKYVKRGLLVTINIEYYKYKINSNLIPYLTQNEFNDINSFSKALIESIEKSLNQEKSKEETTMSELKIKDRVIFNAPATVVCWSDKSKQVLKCREQDEWDEEKALALAIAYKLYGKKEFNELLKNARRITDDSKAKITVLNTTETNDEVCDCGDTCSCKVTCTKNGIESCTGSTTAESNIINELIIEIRNLRADVDKLAAKRKRKSKKNEKNEE